MPVRTIVLSKLGTAALTGAALVLATGCGGGSESGTEEKTAQNTHAEEDGHNHTDHAEGASGDSGELASADDARVADFTVQRVNGPGAFSLSEAQGEWVVLHFLLKTECPMCRRTTDTYASRADEVPGVRHVFLKPDAPDQTQQWINGFEDPKDVAPIYQDPGAQLAERMGIPDGYEFHGEVVHYPALVVIDPEGREVFRYVGERTQDRYPFEQFKTTMAELRDRYQNDQGAG